MSGRPENSPMTLVRRAVWGMALIMSSSVPLVFSPRNGLGAHVAGPVRIWALGGFLVLMLAGFVVSYTAERRMKRWVQADLWSEGELEPARAWLDGRAPGIVFALTFMCFAGILWALRWNAVGFLPALVFPLGSVGRLRNMLQKPQRGMATVDRNQLKPLRSDCWGQ